jgi:UPF0042 nucleotide-binding protein
MPEVENHQNSASQRRFLIISGLSGAGKTVVLHALEDFGFYCIDNLPVGILENLAVNLKENNLPHIGDIAVGIDVRNHVRAIAELPKIIRELNRQKFATELVFIQASDETLVKRFSETSRRHPLFADDRSLTQAISLEREILDSIIDSSHLRIDTSMKNVHELRRVVRELVMNRTPDSFSIHFLSFGYKNGLPQDADFIFDVRGLPNPYWQENLRDLSGKDPEVAEFFSRSGAAEETIIDVSSLLERWITRFVAMNRSYLTIAFGCTGGRHRSVYIAEKIGALYRSRGKMAAISHRDTG